MGNLKRDSNGKTKWLVVGGTGQLGSVLCIQLAEAGHQVLAITRTRTFSANLGIECYCADLVTDASYIADLIRSTEPDVIVNCAAVTNVNSCENNLAARKLNAEVPGELAQLALLIGASYVQISTDSVYNLQPGYIATENNTESPLNAYARSKLDGESAALLVNPMTLVVRTNFFGWNPQPGVGLAEWIVAALSRGEHIRGFEDISFSPLHTETLAIIIRDAVHSGLNGIYLAGCADCITKYEFAVLIAIRLGLDATLVKRGYGANGNMGADRPANSKSG